MLISQFEGKATLENIRHMRSLFTCERLGLRVPQAVLDDLCLAVSELAANALHHSNGPPTRMEMTIFSEGTRLKIILVDDGDPFSDFQNHWARGQTAPMDPLAEEGRGMWLVRNAVDELSYEHQLAGGGNTNKWTISRNLSAREKPAILLLEDDTTTRGLFVTTLSQMAHVSCAVSIAEARAALDDTVFDLVIADYNLGDGSSADLLEHFNSINAELEMPFIFVTGDQTGRARKSALQHGIHTVLEKPVRPRDLLERAREAIAARHAHELRASRRLVRSVDPLIAMRDTTSVCGFRIKAGAAVASTGGGDLFMDFGGVADEEYAYRRLVLADCVGHGMPARMQAALLSGLMAGVSHSTGRGTAQFIGTLSDLIYKGGIADGIIATVLAVDLLPGHRLELATGGHPSPMIVTKSGEMRSLSLKGSLPGLMVKSDVAAEMIQLMPGERLFMATDGTAPDSASMLSGMPKELTAIFAASPGLSIEEISQKIERTLCDVMGPYPMDDWTFVIVEREDFQPAPR